MTNGEPAHYAVAHPLDDVPEQKLDPAMIQPIHVTQSVKQSLFALRAYLVLMLLLVVYRVAVSAGAFGN